MDKRQAIHVTHLQMIYSRYINKQHHADLYLSKKPTKNEKNNYNTRIENLNRYSLHYSLSVYLHRGLTILSYIQYDTILMPSIMEFLLSLREQGDENQQNSQSNQETYISLVIDMNTIVN
jgi:hypothetical protein